MLKTQNGMVIFIAMVSLSNRNMKFSVLNTHILKEVDINNVFYLIQYIQSIRLATYITN